MTLLHWDGFDLGDALPRYGVNFATSASTRYGQGLCLSQQNTITKSFATPLAEIYTGIAVSGQGNLDAALRPYLQFWNDTTAQWVVGFSTSTLYVRSNNVNGTLLASAGKAFSPTGWYYLEVWWKPHASTGRIVVKVDGTTLIDYTGNTIASGGAAQVNTLTVSANGVPISWDDWYICDAVGSAPFNSFLGDVQVLNLAPVGAGTTTGLTPSTGANWATQDERPFSATDYVQGTSGQKDTYAMADLPANIASVLAVRASSVAKKTDSGAASMRNVIRSGGTDYPGTAVSLGASDTTLSAEWLTDPATAAAWSIAGVNALEAGIEVL